MGESFFPTYEMIYSRIIEDDDAAQKSGEKSMAKMIRFIELVRFILCDQI